MLPLDRVFAHAAIRADERTPDCGGIGAVPNSEDERPPMHFGDYPDGAYWSADRQLALGRGAERHAATDDDEPVDHTVSGSVIRFMWDYGVRVPLWDAEGLLPEESDWLR